MMPMPPSRAIWMAMADSVTVSMAAETNGIFSVIPRVSWDETSVSLGCTTECAGMRSTSSNVSASLTIFEAPRAPSTIGRPTS